MLDDNDRPYLPNEIPGEDIRRIFGARLTQTLCDRCTTELHQSDSLSADLRFDLNSLEATTDSRLADHDERIGMSEVMTSALVFNLETLKDEVGERLETLEGILEATDRQAIQRFKRRHQISEFLRCMTLIAISFAVTLVAGAAVSGSQTQKDEYAQLAVLMGLGGVVAVATGCSDLKNE